MTTDPSNLVEGAPTEVNPEKDVQLWIGPQHPGITGNMSMQIWVRGDEIRLGRTHIGYLHRGFEKLIERRKFIQAFPIVCRICVPEPDTNEYLLAASIEELAGLEVPEKGLWLRTLVMEMSRLAATIQALGGQAGSMGLGLVPNWTYTLRDYILDAFEELTGGRVYHMYTVFGGVRRDMPDGFKERLEETLKLIEKRLPAIDNVVFDNAVFQKRAVGIGVVKPEWVDEMGISGPTARGCGLPRDIRRDFPYLKYGEIDFDVTTHEGGDIFARSMVRRGDIVESIKIIRQILARFPMQGRFCAKLPNMLHWEVPKGQTFVRAEASRGEMSYYAATDGSDKARRVHVRGPSYVHAMSLLERMLPGTIYSDMTPMMVSMQTCPPEIER
ncbi:MAG: NADH-quinone oxidoreductase subunit D [Deltaproteobacteria bacterium]|nr:MAG: NADH-quinone oxidoreductase subunit D [Deltaproteobacteria bacterium]